MLPDRVSNPGPLTYESGALPIALRGPALKSISQRQEMCCFYAQSPCQFSGTACLTECFSSFLVNDLFSYLHRRLRYSTNAPILMIVLML